MFVRSFFFGIAASAALASGAMAADYYSSGADYSTGAPANDIYSGPMFNFEGAYAGVLGGGYLGNLDDQGVGGGTVGIVAGVNFAMSDMILAGLEFQGGVMWPDSDWDWEAYALGRVGVTFSDGIMAYGAAGGDSARMPFAIQRYVFVTDSKEDALKAADGARYVRRIAQAMRGKYGEMEGSFLKETPAADEPAIEEIVDRLPIGDPETVAERLGRDIEMLDPSHISCFMAIPGLPQKKILESMERFGAEVQPLLERRFGSMSGRTASASRHSLSERGAAAW